MTPDDLDAWRTRLAGAADQYRQDLRTARSARDQVIRDAVEAGVPIRQVALGVGMTRNSIYRIVRGE